MSEEQEQEQEPKKKAKREYKADTPMTKLLQRHVPKNVEAFGKLLTMSGVKPKVIYEGFGGLGHQTKWLVDNLSSDCKKHLVWDTDEECCEILKAKFPNIEVFQADFFEQHINPPQDSLVCVDYNNFTMNPTNIKRLAPIFNTGYRWLIGPDLARGKLHLNWERTYHIEECDYDVYIKEFSKRTKEQFGMKIKGYVKAPRSITYVLWEKV